MSQHRALLALALVTFAANAQADCPTTSPWGPSCGPQQFGSDAQHTGRVALRGPRTIPSIAWRVRVGRRVYGSPTLSPEGNIVFAGLDGMVHAVDLEGVERWAFSAPGGVLSSPVRAQGYTLIGYGTPDERGAFVALSSRGSVLWRFESDDEADAPATVALDGSLYLAARGVTAVAADGRVRWRAGTARVLAAPALSRDQATVYTVDMNGELLSLRARDGEVLRRTRVGAAMYGAPLVLDDGTVIVGAVDGHVRAYRADGAVAWDTNVGGEVRTTPALGRDNAVIVGADDYHVHALDAATGAERWRLRTGNFVRASATVDADGWIYIGSEDDQLYAINPAGQQQWALTLGADIDSTALIVREGVIAVGCDDAALYLLR